jgi:hypothetical protein
MASAQGDVPSRNSIPGKRANMDAHRSVTEYTEKASIWISRGSMARIQNGRGVLLCVQRGAVWITQTGSIDDVYLDAGESFRIDRDGLTLVCPIGPALLAVVTLEPSIRITLSPAKRTATGFWRLWAGLSRTPSSPSTGWM